MDKKFCAIGEVLWDVFPDGPRFGGAPANVAGHAAALGLDVAMVSCVGDDPLGRQALDQLRQRQINVAHVTVTALWPTGQVKVQLDAAGKPQFTIQQPAAWDHLVWSDALRQLQPPPATQFASVRSVSAIPLRGRSSASFSPPFRREPCASAT